MTGECLLVIGLSLVACLLIRTVFENDGRKK